MFMQERREQGVLEEELGDTGDKERGFQGKGEIRLKDSLVNRRDSKKETLGVGIAAAVLSHSRIIIFSWEKQKANVRKEIL